jgi:catechol 2,3-dioxygenase-like lactoylglutathione lyase family enzyme
MIDALDHIALAVASPAAAAADYQVLLGRRADGASIRLANIKLELRTTGDASAAGALAGLGFATADLDKAERLLRQRALPLTRAGSALQIAREATHGVALSLVEAAAGDAARPSPLQDAEADAAVAALDHVVIRSPNPERAVALYAGRLGLSLRLDRTEPAWGARLLFFRCGDLIVEVAHDLDAGVSDGPDRLWGLSWRAADIGRVHARLGAAGVAVSEIRSGRRPGTRVFTVKNRTANVPTLMLGPDSQA